MGKPNPSTPFLEKSRFPSFANPHPVGVCGPYAKYGMPANHPIQTEEVAPEKIIDLIVFHDELNPKFWDKERKMHPEVRLHLLQSAKAFYEFIELPKLKVSDIVVVGSNAAYNYTDLSDLDVHLIVNFASMDCPDMMENFFGTKKTLWNTQHDISIKGQDVEMYVQHTKALLESNGVYSILKNRWIIEPSHEKPSWDDMAVVAKTNACAEEIENMMSGEPSENDIDELLYRIHHMRRAGLRAGGEFSTENLAYKSLRNLGYLSRLYDLKGLKLDKKLSI